jgi:hypothetical protein
MHAIDNGFVDIDVVVEYPKLTINDAWVCEPI